MLVLLISQRLSRISIICCRISSGGWRFPAKQEVKKSVDHKSFGLFSSWKFNLSGLLRPGRAWRLSTLTEMHAPPGGLTMHSPHEWLTIHAPPGWLTMHAPPGGRTVQAPSWRADGPCPSWWTDGACPSWRIDGACPSWRADGACPSWRATMQALPERMTMHAPPCRMRMHAPLGWLPMHAPPVGMKMHAPPVGMAMHAPPDGWLRMPSRRTESACNTVTFFRPMQLRKIILLWMGLQLMHCFDWLFFAVNYFAVNCVCFQNYS